MTPTLWIVALWALFALTHMGLSSLKVRPTLVARLGDRGFAALFSLVAFAVFIPLAWVYAAHRHEGTLLWAVAIPIPLRWATYALQALAWTLIVGSFVRPSAAAIGGKLPDAASPEPLHLITRHPLFGGVGLFGALHLPFMGFATDVAFWAGFPLFGLLGCWHQDRRKLASEGPGFSAWFERTRFWIWPSPRVLVGLPLWLFALGIALTAGLRWLHGPLFGR